MVEGLTSRTPQGDILRVREVWSDNLEEEMGIIRDIVDKYSYLAMDTEFPGVVARPVGDYRNNGQYQYQALRANVNMLHIIQIGFTFFDDKGNLPRCNDELSVWQFNFREFHPNTEVHATDSIELLKQSGIDFEKNAARGVNVHKFAELLTCSGVVLNSEVRWVTFHSSYDFGYLLKLLTQEPLPDTEQGFFELLKIFFPSIYDIKYLMKFCQNLHGGLNNLAKVLEVERIGPVHQAGSDSLLTSTTFIKLLEKHFPDSEHLKKYEGILFGLGEDGQEGNANNGNGQYHAQNGNHEGLANGNT